MIRRHPVAAYFALAWGSSWILWAPLWLRALGVRGLPVLPHQHALGALGPVGAAFLVAALERGAAGPRDLWRRMVAWRGRPGWVAVGLLAPLALLVAGVVAARMFAGESFALADLGRSRDLPGLGLPAVLLYHLLTFGYGEEVGWRGFALPRLQARRSAFGATLLLTCGWAVWHAPLFLYRPGYASMGLAGAAGWLLSLFTGAILLTWLYNQSRGSLLVVALFHASVDVAFTSDLPSAFAVNVAGALVTAWGIAVLVVAGPRFLSRTGKVVAPAPDGAVTGFVERAAVSGA